jgi:hypothetical protein
MKKKNLLTLISSLSAMTQISEAVSKKPKLTGTFTITNAWTDAKGNTWAKLNYSIPEYNESGYELMKLNKSRTILEGVFSTRHYPSKIDPNAPGYYLSYYHH